MSEWISIKDKLPDNNDPILIHHLGIRGHNFISMGWYNLEYKIFILNIGSECSSVTHWMPPPDKPEEFKNEI